MTAARFAGRRILVVEDEMLIAACIEEILQNLGCIVVGPAGRLDTALRLAADEALDAAVLDVNIRGEQVYPVAEKLIQRRIPFVLASGYGNWALPEAFRDQPRLTKPFTHKQLVEQVTRLFSGHGVC